jgi:hypothetical protein
MTRDGGGQQPRRARVCPGKGGVAVTEEARTSSSSNRHPSSLQWQRWWQPVGEYTIHVLVLTMVDEGVWRWQRRRSAADDSVDGSERQAGGFLPHCCWWRQGNCQWTMNNFWLKVGRRQNYLLTKSCSRSIKVA